MRLVYLRISRSWKRLWDPSETVIYCTATVHWLVPISILDMHEKDGKYVLWGWVLEQLPSRTAGSFCEHPVCEVQDFYQPLGGLRGRCGRRQFSVGPAGSVYASYLGMIAPLHELQIKAEIRVSFSSPFPSSSLWEQQEIDILKYLHSYSVVR